MIGQVIKGLYKIYDEVGSGGIATVYLARNLRTNQIAAVKVVHSHIAKDPEVVKRFQREAGLLTGLSNPHLVQVFDHGIENGRHYLVMEYVEGRTLKSIINEEGALDVDRSLGIARQIAEGLAEVHRRGIVHRDIKPQNLMIEPDGTVKVMDFGIARIADLSALTRSGYLVGTPHYISPEQAMGQQVDHRSDLYSLGVVLYEMLMGRVLFDADSPISVALKHLNEPVPSLRLQRADIPPDVEALVNHCLAKDREERFQSAGELIAAIDRVSGQAVSIQAETAVAAPAPAQSPPVIPPAPVAHRPAAPSPRTAVPGHRKSGMPWPAIGAAVMGFFCLGSLVVAGGFALLSKRGTPTAEARVGPTVFTSIPTSTATPQVEVPTDTPLPATATATGTDVPVPTFTFTPLPTETSIPVPTATFTPIPTPTFTPAPTSTPSTPPAGMFMPGGTFLAVWQDHAEVRDQLGWAVEPEQTPRAGEQRFQHGVMFWRQDLWKIYAVHNAGTWSVYDDTYTDGQPETDPTLVPPPGLIQPKRGFGKVWREQLGGPDAAIGWATEMEGEIGGHFQRFERGLILSNRDGTLLVLRNDGTWSAY
jgi:serine/threonine protein kinase